MFDPGSPSNSDAPPIPVAQSHSSQQLQQHPLWAVASGQSRPMHPPLARGRGRGKATAQPAHDNTDAGARYARISLLTVELQQGATGNDGADSTLLSSDEDNDQDDDEKKIDVSDNEHDYMDSEDDLSGDESNIRPKPHKNERSKSYKRAKFDDSAKVMAAVAFGGQDTNLFGEDSDSVSVVSRSSFEKRKESHKKAFPVKGVTCVVCALANRIAPVERFINTNVGRMSETALWKMASLTWKLEVVDPAKQEGVHVMDWSWRDVANHFRLHTTNAIVGRTHMIQSLTAMRCQVEQRLVRVENGERELDKTNADLCLKILSAESRERTLLASSQIGGSSSRAKSGNKPAGDD